MYDIIGDIYGYASRLHGLNAAAFRTSHLDRLTKRLWPHSVKNRQHAAYQDGVAEDSAPHTEMMAWLKTVFLRLGVVGQASDRPVTMSDEQTRVMLPNKEAVADEPLGYQGARLNRLKCRRGPLARWVVNSESWAVESASKPGVVQFALIANGCECDNSLDRDISTAGHVESGVR